MRAAFVLAVVVGSVVAAWGHRINAPKPVHSRPLVARAVTAEGSHETRGIPSFRLRETTTTWPANSSLGGFAGYRGPIQSISTWWYASPKRWHVSGHYLIPPRIPVLNGSLLSGSAFWPDPGTVVSDGRDIWRYDRQRHIVQVQRIMPSDTVTQFSQLEVISPFGQNTGSLPALLAKARESWRPVIKRSATIAGRDTYLVDLGPNLSLRGSESSHLASGRSVIWVDKKTFLVLQWRLYEPGNPGRLMTQTTVTAVQYGARIPSRLLRFVPPRGTVIDDSRHTAAVAARPYKQALSRLARKLKFPLFAPYDRPAGLTWTVPRLIAPGTVDLAFVPPNAPAGSVLDQTGVTIVERRATADDLAPLPGAIRVAADGAAGWYWTASGQHHLSLVVDGTSITFTSRTLGKSALVTLASVSIFSTVSPAHAPVAVRGVPVITALRRTLSFPVFVPTDVPAGLRLRSIGEGGGRFLPASADIEYRGGNRSLSIAEAWAGCCIDQDVRKWDSPITLPNGVIAFSFASGELWFDRSGTFVVISGSGLAQKQLIAIAGSMSSTARPGG